MGIDYIAAIGESEALEEVLHVEVVVVGVDFYAMHATLGSHMHHLIEVFSCHALALGFVGNGEAMNHHIIAMRELAVLDLGIGWFAVENHRSVCHHFVPALEHIGCAVLEVGLHALARGISGGPLLFALAKHLRLALLQYLPTAVSVEHCGRAQTEIECL